MWKYGSYKNRVKGKDDSGAGKGHLSVVVSHFLELLWDPWHIFGDFSLLFSGALLSKQFGGRTADDDERIRTWFKGLLGQDLSMMALHKGKMVGIMCNYQEKRLKKNVKKAWISKWHMWASSSIRGHVYKKKIRGTGQKSF